MATSVELYLFPRVCPILSLSSEDLIHSIQVYGRAETMATLSSLITGFYDFPFARSGIPRTPAPSCLNPPRGEGKPTPAQASMLLGGYRCTRLPAEIRIPGISLIMRDTLSRLDWSIDTFMEPHRMKCWVAVQGKQRQWLDGRNDFRSPYSRATHTETLTKLLDSELSSSSSEGSGKMSNDFLNHESLREMLLSHGEATPPTVELYLQTIGKLNPKSISAPVIGYGISLAAMICVANDILPCSYSAAGMTENVKTSFRKFIKTADRPVRECGGFPSSSSPEENLERTDLIFIDAFPFGTHDLREYLGEHSTPKHQSYGEHLKKILDPLYKLINIDGRTSRIAMVFSLRESSSLPTIEPLLLTILSDPRLTPHIDLVGALVSSKRDYAVYLMILHSSPRSKPESQRVEWHDLLTSLYPEVFSQRPPTSSALHKKSEAKPGGGGGGGKQGGGVPPTWDSVCLSKVFSNLKDLNPSAIAAQGPRKVLGKLTFPTRTRNCVIISETNNLDTGEIVYVFGDAFEPPPPPTVVPIVEISDSLLSKMVRGIRANASEEIEPPPPPIVTAATALPVI